MPPVPAPTEHHDRRALALKGVLLTLMVLVSFGSCFFARELSVVVMGWPLHMWIASQGAVLVFIAIVAVHAWAMGRLEAGQGDEAASSAAGGQDAAGGAGGDAGRA